MRAHFWRVSGGFWEVEGEFWGLKGKGVNPDPKIVGNGPQKAPKQPRDGLKMGPDRPQNGGGCVRERRNGDTILGVLKRILGFKEEKDEPLATNQSQNLLKTAPK